MQWISRLKNVRANLIVNDNTRVCSCHFEGEFNDSSVPTIFTIEELLPVDIDLDMPPRIPGQRQMTANKFFAAQGIASARIVVEMKMEQFKNYRILAGSLPLSESHLAEQIICLCVAWTNVLPPLIK